MKLSSDSASFQKVDFPQPRWTGIFAGSPGSIPNLVRWFLSHDEKYGLSL